MSTIEKTCRRCQTTKPLGDFPQRADGKLDGYAYVCIDCRKDVDAAKRKRKYLSRKQRGAHKEYAGRNRHRVEKYGITRMDYADMLAAQNGTCAICKQPPSGKRLAIDHCHTSGKVRALLCSHCNTSLGLFRDDPRLLVAAARYLLAHTAKLCKPAAT